MKKSLLNPKFMRVTFVIMLVAWFVSGEFWHKVMDPIPDSVIAIIVASTAIIFGIFAIFCTRWLYGFTKYVESQETNYLFFNFALKFIGSLALFGGRRRLGYHPV
jgi:hypothetical protein